MSFQRNTLRHFDTLSVACFESLAEGEQLTLNLAAEEQMYVRFNNSGVRQSTDVKQARLSLRFQSVGRRIVYTFDSTGEDRQDAATALSLLTRARDEVKHLPEDPFLIPPENQGHSQLHHAGRLPQLEALLGQVTKHTASADFTGLYAGGPQLRAIRNSEGLRHVFSTESFFLDYSLFTVNGSGENKAVKGLYAGTEWEVAGFEQSVRDSLKQLDLLKRDSRELSPGHYRVFFAPAAVEALLSLFSWGGVGYGAWKKGDSALKHLIEGERQLSPLFSLEENFNAGLTPRFNSQGEIAPERLSVIEHGVVRNLLISSRTAREYGVSGNGAESGEGLRSPEMATGELDDAAILASLGTGIYISNLHYLNWSDLVNARITGMTRYACFWVENGEIVSPIRDLRFDESLYRVFGSELESITKTASVLMETDTYSQRALGGSTVPGMLVREFRFTL